MHHLFNVITNKKNIPHGVLIRALEPIEGIDQMLMRTGKSHGDFTLTKGPGNLARAMGMSKFITEGFSFLMKFLLKTTECGIKKIRSSSPKELGWNLQGKMRNCLIALL